MNLRRLLTRIFVGCLLSGSALVPWAVNAEEATKKLPADQVEFFETRVRPVLVEKCISCHGDKKQQASLRLDSIPSMVKGNESGPAIVPGKPADSRLIQVLHYSDSDIQMPPAGKLPAEEIAALSRWVEIGAPWPDDVKLGSDVVQSPAGSHWSFQPISNPPVPQVQEQDQVHNAIDAFVLSKLEANHLTFAKPVDRATFIRRATLDLWGIPPKYEDVQAFVADPSENAVPALIDRLLDSPLYGQRWGRHWLDIARYADTKGYVFTEEARYPYAYTYRDYVVESFNSDKPYNRFLMEQIAADQLDLGDDKSALAGLGFLTVGRRFLNRQHDIIDDRIDVVTRGLMSLTVTCARCHDHKYDPIPTADYYSLFGVFASSTEPDNLPVIGEPKSQTDFEKFKQELAKLQGEVDAFEQQTHTEMLDKLRGDSTTYLVMVVDGKAGDSGHPARDLVTSEPRNFVVQRWRRFLDGRKDPQDRVFAPWNRIVRAADDKVQDSIQQLQKLVEDQAEELKSVHPLVLQALQDQKPTSKFDVAVAYGKLLNSINEEWLALKKEQPDATALPNAGKEELRQLLYADGLPFSLTLAESRNAYWRSERDKQRKLEKAVETLNVTSPGAPPRAMVMNDKERPEEPRILVRGNPGRPGDKVPRQFLKVLSDENRQPFQKGSGRLELAEAIVDPANPLTSRVIVNRVWQHHFGEGLSRTPGDFGIRGEAPTHPELLDYLATQFMQHGWSIKWLHRQIMTSAAYAQSSDDRPDARQIDPENRLLWHVPRQRLELEALRDSWLAAAGRLDTTMGGRPYDSITEPNAVRRTLYGFVNRNDLPGVFRSFDFADVDISMAERPETTVPQQALFALNAPFVVEQAKHLAAAVAQEPDDGARVTALFQRTLSRDPTSEEREQALAFVKTSKHDGKLSNWDKLAQALLLTNEFTFVD